MLDINYIDPKSDRHNLYLKGGVFAPTSRTLIIDLLTNKISPHIINGFVIIDGEETLKGSPAIGENMFMSNTRFILKVYRRDNKDGFIKVFSSNPGLLASKHLNIRDAMKASYVNTLLLYPRNRLEVKESLNSDEILDVNEIDIDLSKCMKEIQQIIITLIHTCLQTLEKELRSYELSDEVFKIESVFNDTFKNSLKNELGNEFNELGDKANRALFDIRLLRYLLTSLYGNDATYFHMAVLETKETCNSYSIFKFSDQETTDLLEKLEQLSKKRMYSIEAKEDGAIKKKKSMGIFSV